MQHFITMAVFARLLAITALLSLSLPVQAVFVSEAKEPLPVIKAIFPEADDIGAKQGEPLVYTIKRSGEVLGYAFETNDVALIPAYSGKPVNMLVAIDTQGRYLAAKVLEHHEPILLVGIPEQKLFDFAGQYRGLSVTDRLKVGGNKAEGYVPLDGLSGATVTVMVINVAITKAAAKVARALGLVDYDKSIEVPFSTIKQDVFTPADWQTLLGDGSLRKLYIDRSKVDEAFAGTEAEHIDKASLEQKHDVFAEIYYAQLNLPNVGKNLLGEREYQWLMETLKPDEHAVVVLGNGYSFKGSGYVRGGIFDRIQVHQKDFAISFRDLDHHRITDIYLPGAPKFREMSLFIIRDHHQFDPGSSWQFELLVRRQLGAVDSVFTSFKGHYDAPDKYLIRPELPMPEPELALWQQVWQQKTIEVTVLLLALAVLLVVLFLQDFLVTFERFIQHFRHAYLVFTVIFIGWAWAGQLSIVNVFTFLNALMSEFSWDLFLLDPAIFILWCAAAVTILLWGRAVYCGWLCPFGALQELLNVVARRIRLPQLELPWAVHERLWAVKYLILLGLFGLSLESLATAERFAEIEPFKTTFLLRFDRTWPYVLWAVLLLVINLFNRKMFCRYLCPMGAALSVATNIKLFSWLKRRSECGTPCKICAKECEIQAIEPGGQINMRECHYCLDCQITYFNEQKCPPLKKMARKKSKMKRPDDQQVIAITTVD